MFSIILLVISTAWSYPSELEVQVPNNDLLEYCLLMVKELNRNRSCDLHLSSVSELINGTQVIDFKEEFLKIIHQIYPVTVDVETPVTLRNLNGNNYAIIFIDIVSYVKYSNKNLQRAKFRNLFQILMHVNLFFRISGKLKFSYIRKCIPFCF